MTGNDGMIVGIDLGTTFSAVACLDRAGLPVTIPNAEGDLTTPSAILFEPDGSVVVGKPALRAASVQPDRVATCVKRDMGETFYGRIIAGRRWKPQHLSAYILGKIKQDAQRRMGPIRGAVITVPAYYDEARRQATVEAGRIAGLNVIDIINEPTAAALAYAYRTAADPALRLQSAASPSAPATIMVYDLGGGTFDVTIIRRLDQQVNVLATDGDLYLGGRDWDERIINHAARLFLEQHAVDPREDPQCYQELWRSAEDAKKDLSARQSTIFSVSHAGKHLGVSMTREQFESMTKDLLYRTESRIVRVLKNARLTWGDIDEVLLVGGSSRMPQVREMIASVSGKEPNSTLAFDEIVAHGAVVHGAILAAQGKVVAAMVNFSGAAPAVAVPADLPKAGPAEVPLAVVAETEEEDVPLDFDSRPVELGLAEKPKAKAAPAKTAAPQAAPVPQPLIPLDAIDELTRALQGFVTVNVNAHSLGVVAFSNKTGGELSSVIIPRNTPLPASNTKCYGTMMDSQAYIRIRIIEGEARTPEACIPIGECVVGPLPPGLPKKSRVSVTFSYDDSGLLHVTAKQHDSGVTAQSTLVRPQAMSAQELDRAAEAVAKTRIS